MAKNDKEIDILNDIINLLIQTDMTADERSSLQLAKQQLEKHVYFPKIIRNLEMALTPLARQQKLSKMLSPLYLKITSQEFKNKYQGFGYGLGMNFGGGNF